MNWRRYLIVIAAILVLLPFYGSYQDYVDGEPDSITQYATRFLLMFPIAIGLCFRSVWAVRIVYSFSIGMLILMAISGAMAALPLTWPQLAVMTTLLLPFALAVLIPRDALLPARKSFVAEGHAEDLSNPYSPPSAENTSTTR